MEIERKYLVKEMPDTEGCRKIIMQQHYLCADPAVRIRKADERYIFTYKSGSGLVRREEEFDISEEDFNKLLERRTGNGVYKTRYIIPLDEKLHAELDIYEKQLAGLVVVEVEFGSREEAESFTAPEWFGEEVTDHPEYTNAMLAFHVMQ